MKMRMMIAVSILALAICASPARATLIAYEGFDYSPAGYLDGLNGGTGFNSAWEDATSPGPVVTDSSAGSLNYVGNPTPVTGGYVNFVEPSSRTLTTPLTYNTGDTYYMSFLIRKDFPGVGVYVKLVNGDHHYSNYTYRTWLGGISGSTDNFSYGGVYGHFIDLGYTVGTMAMVVTRLVALPDTNEYERSYSYFQSPASVSTTEPGDGAWDVTRTENASSLARGADTLWVMSGAAMGGSIDEIRIGTTFADVIAGAAALPGDFDADNDVDGVDFGLWQSGYPTASGANLIDGDADGDGDVDGVDFGIWQANYPTNVGGAATIPEPATLGLLLVGGLTLFKRRQVG